MRTRIALTLGSILTVLIFWCTFTLGCATTIVPPAHVQQPVTVYLIDHGRTPSLVIPDPDSRTMTRYAFGDWRYYALAQNDLFHGIAALFWPTQATLGRQVMFEPLTEQSLRKQVAVGIEHLHSIEVEAANASHLHAKLEDLYRQNLNTEVINSSYAMNFVHHPRSYTLLYTSNHAVAEWLGELGCDVRGPIAVSNWKLKRMRPRSPV